jgi:hypothetical protein
MLKGLRDDLEAPFLFGLVQRFDERQGSARRQGDQEMAICT